jgi:hypothetical protein
VLFNSIIVAITIPFRVAFENKPKWYSVSLEAYLNVVFLIDFIKHFLSPPSTRKTNNQTRRLYYSKKEIAIMYMWTDGLKDLYCMFPVALIRSQNVWELGGFDVWQNIKSLNFERLPRLYKILLMFHLLRAR